MTAPRTSSPPTTTDADLELLLKLKQARFDLKTQIGRRIVGQQDIVDNLVAAILAGGHVLLVGVPGLAKTLLIQTLAEALALPFNRVQFTPDLMPGDITGTELLEEDQATGRRIFTFAPGPVFASIVLADEINRAPPKTQAALLQAMQEHTVTVAGKTHILPDPFFVLATQNPIEQEGTYHLPEAQRDRFMFELNVDYPSREEEEAIVSTTTGVIKGAVEPVLSGAQLVALQQLVRRLPAAPTLVRYAVDLARSTRPTDPTSNAEIRKYVAYGAGPRASQYLILGAKAKAAMEGRAAPDIDDLKGVALSVLGHRLLLNFQAEAEGMTVQKLLKLG